MFCEAHSWYMSLVRHRKCENIELKIKHIFFVDEIEEDK